MRIFICDCCGNEVNVRNGNTYIQDADKLYCTLKCYENRNITYRVAKPKPQKEYICIRCGYTTHYRPGSCTCPCCEIEGKGEWLITNKKFKSKPPIN